MAGLFSSVLIFGIVSPEVVADQLEDGAITLPVDPEPSEPEIPVDPEPSEPEIPVDPEPEVPTEPSEPEVPVDPEPEVPTEPSEPEVPVDPEPEVPTEPSEPEVPVDPEPEKPSQPEPNEPTTPEKPSKPIESDGSNSNMKEQKPKPTNPTITAPSVEAPVVSEKGEEIIAVENSRPIIRQVDGTVKPVEAQAIGATVQKDGTVTVKANDGKMKVLPKTGEKENILFSTIGGLLTVVSGFVLFNRKKIKVRK